MADAYLVDTGVFVRWLVDQAGIEHARKVQRAFVGGAVNLETLDFARVEVAGVLRKKGYLANRLTSREFVAAVRVIDDVGVTVLETTADRLERAADLTLRQTLRLYDALFVQVAVGGDRSVLAVGTGCDRCRQLRCAFRALSTHGAAGKRAYTAEWDRGRQGRGRRTRRDDRVHASSREESKCRYVPRADHGEMPPVHSGDLGELQAFGYGDHSGIDDAKWKIDLGLDELGQTRDVAFFKFGNVEPVAAERL